MELPWGLLIFLIGIVWGLVAPGRQRKARLIANGLLIGVILGLVFSLLGYTMDKNPMGVGTTWWTFIVAFFVLTIIFTLGVWIGDIIEGAARRRPI
jgi:hypothetical protein